MKIKKLTLFAIIILSVFFGYLIGIRKVSLMGRSVELTTLEPPVMEFFSGKQDCRLLLQDTNDLSIKDTLFGAKLYSLPEPPDTDLPHGNLDSQKMFDENEGYEDDPLYSQMFESNSPPNWFEVSIDIDGDLEPERALTNNLAMTQGPHLLRIVKDERVVFEYVGAGVSIEPAFNGKPGFFLRFDNDWQSENGILVRYVVSENGSIEPVWQQRHCGFEVE